ncbi:hypothetical protein FQZ97_916820 [compost metagenome]
MATAWSGVISLGSVTSHGVVGGLGGNFGKVAAPPSLDFSNTGASMAAAPIFRKVRRSSTASVSSGGDRRPFLCPESVVFITAPPSISGLRFAGCNSGSRRSASFIGPESLAASYRDGVCSRTPPSRFLLSARSRMRGCAGTVRKRSDWSGGEKAHRRGVRATVGYTPHARGWRCVPFICAFVFQPPVRHFFLPSRA